LSSTLTKLLLPILLFGHIQDTVGLYDITIACFIQYSKVSVASADITCSGKVFHIKQYSVTA